jgi:hypothetical protein
VALHFAELADQNQPRDLKLANPLFPDPEFLAHLPEQRSLAVHHSGAHPQDVGCAVVQVNQLALAEGVQVGVRQMKPPARYSCGARQ